MGSPYPIRVGGIGAISTFVVHHTGDGPARPTADEVAAFQISPSAQDPFPSIAYSLYVESNGALAICYDLEREPWSQGLGSPSVDANGEGINNALGLSCCFSGQDPNDQQWATILAGHTALEVVCGRSLRITGHGLLDQGTTSCPGPVATARLQGM